MLGIKTQNNQNLIYGTSLIKSELYEYDRLHWKDLDSTAMRNQTPRRRFSKPRIGQAAKEVVKPSNRTHDLHSLTSQFDVLKIKLSQLIEALKVHYKAMSQINKSRLAVAEKVSALATNSPLSDYAGQASDEARDDVTTSNLDSYLDVHRNLNLRHEMYVERFLEHIVQYSVDWFNTVESRVSTSLKKANKLRKDLEHYENKCNRLRFDKGRVAKGGTGTDAYLNVQSKLDRNERKLQNAKEEYESFSDATASLVHEVTANCWKDLFPVLMKLTQFDASLVSDEARLLRNLSSVTMSLSKLQKQHNFDPETRMEELENGIIFLSLSKEAASSSSSLDIIDGVQNKLDMIRSATISQVTPQITNSGKSTKPTDVGNTRILSFGGESPKIEVDFSFDVDQISRKDSYESNEENKTNNEAKSTSSRSKKSSSRLPPSFSGRSKDQNASSSVLKHKIKKNKKMSTTESYFGGNTASTSHFDDIDGCETESLESNRYPLTPVTQYR